MAWPRSTAGQCMPSGAHTAVTHPRAHTGTYRYMSSKQLNSRAISPFKEIEEVDQENSPKPRQKHFKSKTLGFSVPAGIDMEQRALIPLKDGNRRHLGTIWGGNNFGFQYFKDEADAFRTYSEAAKRYRDVVAKAGADVFISSHIAQDRIPDKINALKFRNPGEPHPFVDKDAPLRHLTVVAECAAARLAGETKSEISRIQ